MLLFAVQLMQDVQFLSFAAIFGGMFFSNRKNRSLFWLCWNYLLGSLGLVISLWRPHAPAWLSNVAGMEIPQLRYGLLHLAILSFVGRSLWSRWIPVVLAVSMLPLYLLWSGSGYQDPVFSVRNFAALDLALGIEAALTSWVLLRSPENATRLPRLAMSGFLLLYSLTEFARLATVFVTHRAPENLASWVELGSLAIYHICGRQFHHTSGFHLDAEPAASCGIKTSKHD